jgi:hypothetical protein
MQIPIELHYTVDGTSYSARLLRGGLGGAMLDGTHAQEGALVRFVVRGGVNDGQVQGTGRISRLAVPGAPPTVHAIKLLRLQCGEGLPPLKELLREHLHTEYSDLPHDRVTRIANFWSVVCAPDDPEAPLVRLPPIDAARIATWFRPPGGHPVLNVYVRRTVCYLVNFVPFHGRGVRMNESSFLIHSNNLLPSLGGQVHVQIPVHHRGLDTWVVLTGGVQRRSDQKEQSVFKGSFEMRVDRVEEIEAEGAFFHLLATLATERDDA